MSSELQAPTVVSLLRAIVNLDGEALVLNAGKRPHIVTLNGNVEIGSRPLPAAVIDQLTGGLLSTASLAGLRTFGTTVAALPADDDFKGERFVVTATGRDATSVVIRRERGMRAGAVEPGAPVRPARFPSLVLMIDDSLDQLDLYELALVDKFAVLTASMGQAGIALAVSELPDAVVLDVDMPGMDGWEVCRQLKGCPETQDIPIIMLTAGDDPRVVDEAALAGVAELLHKPCSVDRLRDRLTAVLRC